MEEKIEIEKDKETKEDNVTLLDYLIVLAKHKWLIISITFLTAVIMLVKSLALPNLYLAETSVLTPSIGQTSIESQILRKFGGLPESASSLRNTPKFFTAILQSRSVYDRIIDRFELMEGIAPENREDLRKSLEGQVNAVINPNSSLLVISVKDKDPQMAADMANAFVDALKDQLQELAVTETSQRRLFFEEQMKEVKEELIKSEEAIRKFQEKTGVLKVEAQTGIVISSIANLRAQIAAKEVELKVMRTYYTPNNPDLQKEEETLDGLKIELAKLEAKGENSDSTNTLITTGQMPAISIDYIRKLRDLKFNETLFELMTKQFELAKIEEAKNPQIIQVIDKAIPTKLRAGPDRKMMILKSTLISFFLAIILAFLLEHFNKLSNEWGGNEKIRTFKRHLSFKRRK